MKQDKRKKLESAGWKVGTTGEFLGLSVAEEAFIELKLSLARAVRCSRISQDISQAEAARRIGSSQSRFAKMEAADPSVSTDLLIRTLLALGATPDFLARAITGAMAIGEPPAKYGAATRYDGGRPKDPSQPSGRSKGTQREKKAPVLKVPKV